MKRREVSFGSIAPLSPSPVASDLPGATDILGIRRHVSKVAKLGITPVEHFSPEVAQGRKLAVMT